MLQIDQKNANTSVEKGATCVTTHAAEGEIQVSSEQMMRWTLKQNALFPPSE